MIDREVCMLILAACVAAAVYIACLYITADQE